jgi:hypothetical protein
VPSGSSSGCDARLASRATRSSPRSYGVEPWLAEVWGARETSVVDCQFTVTPDFLLSRSALPTAYRSPDARPGATSLATALSPLATVRRVYGPAIEFHTWNSTIHDIDRPDRVIFDLDPGAGVTWQHLQEAAVLTRAMLAELQL